MPTALATTPLHDWHIAHGARMVDFAGWSMPVQYTSVVEEHNAVRGNCGVFDVSHMGRFRFTGPGAVAFLDRLLTRRVTSLTAGDIRYSLVCNAEGGILDDVLVYCLENSDADNSGTLEYWLVVNAGNREKISAWVQKHLSEAHEVTFEDLTTQLAMIAIQGPRALELVAELLPADPARLKYYSGAMGELGPNSITSRTGYTGEDGCELIVPNERVVELCDALLAKGAVPAGLGARDTLRLEAAMPLYGHELSEEIDPYQAGLGFAVQLKDRDFLGRTALVERKEAAGGTRLVGLELASRRVPREEYPVLTSEGQPSGRVTSGTFSPTLAKPIAMAYVPAAHAALGTQLNIDIRGRHEPAQVVKLPFYKRDT